METREPVLVVMAAGIGSRYGAGVKQLAQVGPSGELIIDYSVYDAIAAGFKKVIFIIRKEIEADFRDRHIEKIFSTKLACPDHGASLEELEPRMGLPEDPKNKKTFTQCDWTRQLYGLS